MSQTTTERRQHERFPLGLPVKVRLPGRPEPLTVELMDLSASGARFQASTEDLRGDVRVAGRVGFGFVVPDQASCQAGGQVVRVERGGQFVLALDDTNEAFAGFIRLLTAES